MITGEELQIALQPLNDVRQTRIRRVLPIQVVDQAKFGGPAKTGIGNEGTVIIVLSRNAKVHDAAMEAIAEGGSASQKFIQKLGNQLSKLTPPTSVEEYLKTIKKGVPVGAITYCGCTLVDPIWLPAGLDTTLLVFPYNGGRLLASGFKLVEYISSESDPSLCATALKYAPKLTAAEREALTLVPPDMVTVHIGNHAKCTYTTLAALGGATIGAIVGTITAPVGIGVGAIVGAGVGYYAGQAFLNNMTRNIDVHLTDSQISKLGPAQTAKTLVNLRREALLKLAEEAERALPAETGKD